MSAVSRARAEWVEQQVRAHCFGAVAAPEGRPLTFGAELELLAFDARTHRIAPIRSNDEPSLLDVVRAVGSRFGWRERSSPKGAPTFVAPTGAQLTFEPGGQLEYASAVHHSLDTLARELDDVERALRECAEADGIELLACGVDPFNGADSAELQLDGDRYRRMASYFATIGADGARMMRQTASLQLCIGGIDLCARWRLANALAPWLVAMFANSPRYAGVDTGCMSYRAETWRGVDAMRTGVLEGRSPVREYAAFALAAPAFLGTEEGAAVLPFARLSNDAATCSALTTHLSTLFPEARPRGYLELRSLDSVNAKERRSALALVAGLLGDGRSAEQASELLGDPDAGLLRAAGREGMSNPTIAASAPDLLDLALAGCERLGESIVSRAFAVGVAAQR